MLSFNHDPYDGRIYHREAMSLANHGYSVSILSLYDGKRQNRLEKNITVKYIEVINSNIYILFLMKLYALFREAFKVNADIYHCHEPESHLVALAIKIFKRKIIIYDVHEYYRDLIKNTGRFYGYFYLLTSYVIEPLLCWLDDYIICADDEIKKLYSKYNNNIVSLFNYPLLNYWDAEDNHLPDVQKTKHTLIYAGGVSEVRGVLLMLAVVAELVKVFSDVRLVIIGEIASSALKNNIDRYIQMNNLESAVTFLGNIPHQDVASYMKSASVGLLLYEAFKKFYKNIPTKQYEYAASGLAVIASDLPPIRDFVLPNKCGVLVTPGKISEAVEAISYLFNHPDELERLGHNGKNIVAIKFNWHAQERKLINAYKIVEHGY